MFVRVSRRCRAWVPTYPTSSTHFLPRSRWTVRFHCCEISAENGCSKLDTSEPTPCTCEHPFSAEISLDCQVPLLRARHLEMTWNSQYKQEIRWNQTVQRDLGRKW